MSNAGRANRGATGGKAASYSHCLTWVTIRRTLAWPRAHPPLGLGGAAFEFPALTNEEVQGAACRVPSLAGPYRPGAAGRGGQASAKKLAPNQVAAAECRVEQTKCWQT
jgi:hypothetical protein